MTSSVYGRFVLEEDGDHVRLGVRSADALPWIRAGSLVVLGLLVLEPGLIVGPPPHRGAPGDGLAAAIPALAAVALLIAFMVLGLQGAAGRGRARSRHARVRRGIDVRWGANETEPTPFREGSGGPACSVDGRRFAPADLVGVVTFESTEYRHPGSKNPEKTERYRPTLVMRDCLFELDVFEQADAPNARELSDVLASSLARRRTKAPVVRGAPPGEDPGAVGWMLLDTALLLGTLFFCGPFAWAHPAHRYVVSAALLAFGAGNLIVAERLARRMERRISGRAHDLVAQARAALASGS